jgi:Peptidase C13 family
VTRARAILIAVSLAMSFLTQPALAAVRVLIVGGLGGEPGYEQKFQTQAKAVASAASRSGAATKDVVVITGEQARRAALDPELKKFAAAVKNDDQVVVVLIGHGSFDGEEYRFNLPGPDITGKEILAFLDSMPASQMLVVNATSSSGSVIEQWRKPNRVVITATKSGGERNATRFAEYWVQALSSPEADRDKNEIVTAQEAYDYASRKVADTFKSDAALATEHSRLDGKNADRIVVARLGSAALLPNDDKLDAMMKEQGTLETQLDALKAKKGSLAQDEYYNELEKVLLDVARLDKRIDARKTELLGPSAATGGSAGGSNAPKTR